MEMYTRYFFARMKHIKGEKELEAAFNALSEEEQQKIKEAAEAEKAYIEALYFANNPRPK